MKKEIIKNIISIAFLILGSCLASEWLNIEWWKPIILFYVFVFSLAVVK